MLRTMVRPDRRKRPKRPPLTTAQILAWADEHRRQTGAWPRARSGPVPGAAGETWAAVNQALYRGLRGLEPGQTLRRLLKAHNRE